MDIEIDKIEAYKSCLDEHDICLRVSWSANIGFGQFEMIINDTTGKVSILTECLGRDFAKQLLSTIIDQAELVE